MQWVAIVVGTFVFYRTKHDIFFCCSTYLLILSGIVYMLHVKPNVKWDVCMKTAHLLLL